MSWIIRNLVGSIGDSDEDDDADEHREQQGSPGGSASQTTGKQEAQRGSPDGSESRLRGHFLAGAKENAPDGDSAVEEDGREREAEEDRGPSQSIPGRDAAGEEAGSRSDGKGGEEPENRVSKTTSKQTEQSPAADGSRLAQGSSGERGEAGMQDAEQGRGGGAEAQGAPVGAVKSRRRKQQVSQGVKDDLAELTGRMRDGLSFFSFSSVMQAVTDVASAASRGEEPGEDEEDEDEDDDEDDEEDGEEAEDEEQDEDMKEQEGDKGQGGPFSSAGMGGLPEMDVLDVGLLTLGRIQSMVTQTLGVSGSLGRGDHALEAKEDAASEADPPHPDAPGTGEGALETESKEPQPKEKANGVAHGDEGDEEDEDEENVGLLVSELITAAKQDMQELSGTLVHGISGFSSLANRWISVAAASAASAGTELQHHGEKGAVFLWSQLGPVDGYGDGESEDEAPGEEAQAQLVQEDAHLQRALEGVDSGHVQFPGATKEVVVFAHNISQHPQTWLHFPLPLEYAGSDKERGWTQAQQAHITGIEELVPGLARLRQELCPSAMTVDRFWTIYFVLVHARMPPDCLPSVCTQQVIDAKNAVLAALQQSQGAASGASDEQPLKDKQVPLAAPGIVQEPDGPLAVGAGPGTAAWSQQQQGQQSSHAEQDASEKPQTPQAQEAGEDLQAHAPAGDSQDNEAGMQAVKKTSEVKASDSQDWGLDESLDEFLAESGGNSLAASGGNVDLDEDLSFSDLEDDDEGKDK